MKQGHLSQYFSDFMAKRLSAVEADPEKSNQREFNSVEPLRRILGEERRSNFAVDFMRVGDDEDPFSEKSYVTWYDSRENHPDRSEFRLYFKSNSVMERASEGDLLIIARKPSGEIIIIVAERGSTAENQLLWLFNSREEIGAGFEYRPIEDAADREISFAVRFVFGQLGLEIKEPEENQTDILDMLLDRFGGIFPTTAEFSAFARESLPDVNPLDGPDAALVAWADRERSLFLRLERHIVGQRLALGFMSDGEVDVDEFIQYSLSVHNRRKSRAGYGLEHHLAVIFDVFRLKFDRQAKTEGNSKPDFLFPGANEYHNHGFPLAGLTMLGVKSSCKERWRQVLAEAKRIPDKHLFTLEPSINENQTDEMRSNSLQLILPKALHTTYQSSQQKWLMNLTDFIDHIKAQQRHE